MPIYEYKCDDCGKQFSLLQQIGANEKNTKCADCGSRKVHKLISSFSSIAVSSFGSSGASSFSGGG